MSKDMLQAAIALTREKLSGHYAGLLQERRSGSKWGKEPGESLWDLPWEEFTPPAGSAIPGCRYFRAAIAGLFPGATLGAVPQDTLSDEEWLLVRPAIGAHGRELVGTVKARSATTATLIVGDEPGVGTVVFTVHPGEPMQPLGNPAVKAG